MNVNGQSIISKEEQGFKVLFAADSDVLFGRPTCDARGRPT